MLLIGVVSDDSPNSIAPARSLALQKSDVILLLGARLNWMLHFGRPPRYNPDAKVIQIDLCAEELHNSVKASVAIQSDLKPAIKAITEELNKTKFCFSNDKSWWRLLANKCKENREGVKVSNLENINSG